MDVPISFPDFAERFATEELCMDYLVKVRWPDGTPTHPVDSTPATSFLRTRGLWKFRDGYQMSVKVGTVMEGSRTPLRTWFWAAYWVAVHTPGVSATQLAKHLSLRYETAFNILHKLRAGLVNPNSEMLRGTLEVDEAYVGGRGKDGKGRGSKGKTAVVGAIEIKRNAGKRKQDIAGRLRLQVVPDVSAASLQSFINATIRRGSVITTDGWSGYNGLSGYRHRIVIGENSKEVAEKLPHIHQAFSNLKAWLLGTHHGVSGKHLQAYLNEYTFRHNRRNRPFTAFRSSLGLGVQAQAPTYRELYDAGRTGGWIHPKH